jgi:hypothetical protein
VNEIEREGCLISPFPLGPEPVYHPINACDGSFSLLATKEHMRWTHSRQLTGSGPWSKVCHGALTHHSAQGDPENPGLDALGLFQRKGKQMAEGRNAHLLTKYTKACEEADVGFLRLSLSPQPKTRRRYILNPNAVLPPVETYDPNNNHLYRHARPRHPSHSPHLRILQSHQRQLQNLFTSQQQQQERINNQHQHRNGSLTQHKTTRGTAAPRRTVLYIPNNGCQVRDLAKHKQKIL